MDIGKARFALELMERYDALHWDVKALQQNEVAPDAVMPGSPIDRSRFAVSQFFANLDSLVAAGYITPEFANKAIPKSAHRLCEKYLEPLNAVIRARRMGEETAESSE